MLKSAPLFGTLRSGLLSIGILAVNLGSGCHAPQPLPQALDGLPPQAQVLPQLQHRPDRIESEIFGEEVLITGRFEGPLSDFAAFVRSHGLTLVYAGPAS